MPVADLGSPDGLIAARTRGGEHLPREIGRSVTFGDARFPEEYPEILALRLRAHQHDGQLAGFAASDLASSFDTHSRHLVCRLNGRILGCVRLIHVDGDPARSQYVAWGKHEVPGWLWQAGFLEAGAGAMEPEYRMSGLFLALVQHLVRTTRQLNHRYLLGASEDHLLPMYQKMGFSWLEARNVEPRPGWRFHSHLFVMDLDGLLQAPREGRWVAMMAAAVASVDAVSGSPPATSAQALP